MSYIYKVSISVDMFGKIGDYSMRVFKHVIKSETNLNYILLGERYRVKKTEINIIREGLLINSSKHISYLVWILNEKDIVVYKDKIIDKIKETIELYRQQIQKLETLMENNLKITIHDETKLDEPIRTEITEDML